MRPRTSKRKVPKSPNEDKSPSIDEQAAKKSNKMNDTNDRLDKIMEMISNSTTEQKNNFAILNEKIDTITTHFDAKIDVIEKTCQENTIRINNTENAIERLTKASELRIVKLPMSDTLDLPKTFKLIAEHIGYDTSNPTSIPLLSHIKMSKDGKSTNSGTVLAQFVAPHIKKAFYDEYLTKMPIPLNKIGFECDGNIIISENLTKDNAKLFLEAHKHKIANKFQSVYTVNGLVQIKIKKGTRAMVINNQSDIEIALAKANITEPMETEISPNMEKAGTPTTSTEPNKK